MTSPIDGLTTELKENGIEGINNLIARREQEQYFIDFKAFSISDYSGKKSLEDSDRKNFSKAISGFGNSEGGVIIWGISGKNHAEKLEPVKGYETFLSLLNGFISRCTIPAHTSIENFSIKQDDGHGFVITIVPKSENTPHRTIDGQNEGQYYMRAGDSFLPVPHSVLAGMFGRRPSPKVIFLFGYRSPIIQNDGTLILTAEIQLINTGQGLAKNIYCQGSIINIPKVMVGTQVFEFIGNTRDYRASIVYKSHIQCYSIGEFFLAPGQVSIPLIVNIRLIAPFDNDLKIVIGYGCEGQEKGSYELYYSKERLFEIYTKALSGISAEDLIKIMKDDVL